jgi:hypothetical protein
MSKFLNFLANLFKKPITVKPPPPKDPFAEITNLVKDLNPDQQLVLLGVRAKINKRGIYDDMIYIIGPKVFHSFEANVDPQYFRKRIANLTTGTWLYKIGTHNITKAKILQYKALVQAAPVTVYRDEVGLDTGWFGINIHKGSVNSVSSIGCQTIKPKDWDLFINTVETEMKKNKQKTIRYRLIQG